MKFIIYCCKINRNIKKRMRTPKTFVNEGKIKFTKWSFGNFFYTRRDVL